MPSSLSPAQIARLEHVAINISASRFFTFSTFSLLIYDHILTVPEEVELVWGASFTLTKILFLINRYVPPLFLAMDMVTMSGLLTFNDNYCRHWIMLDAIVELFTLCATTLIIAYRIYAVWGKSQAVFYILGSGWILHVVGSAIELALTIFTKNAPSLRAEPIFKTCDADVTDAWTIWLPAIFFHIVIFILLVVKAVLTPRNAKTPMLRVLLRDGMLYFVIVFCAFLFNLLVWAVGDESLSALPHHSVWAVCTIATSRLLLSLRPPAECEQEYPDDEAGKKKKGDTPCRPICRDKWEEEGFTLTYAPPAKLFHWTTNSEHWKAWNAATAAIIDFSDFSSRPYQYKRGQPPPQLPPIVTSSETPWFSWSQLNSPTRSATATPGRRSRRQSVTTEVNQDKPDIPPVPNIPLTQLQSREAGAIMTSKFGSLAETSYHT